MLHPWKNAAQLIKCSFHRKPRPSRVSLKCTGLENISQVARNRPKVDRYHPALKTLWATFWVLKLAGAIFWPRKSKPSVRFFLLCQFHQNPRASRLSLESLGLKNIPPVAGNRPEVGRYHIALEAVSASFSVLKWSGAIFRPRSSKPSVRSFNLSPFHRELSPSRIRLESRDPKLVKITLGSFSVLK